MNDNKILSIKIGLINFKKRMVLSIDRFSIFSYFFLYACCIANLSFAQSYHYHQYTIEDGLPTDAVYGAMQDSKGYIWIFTEKGISKFDGYDFKTFTMADGLPSNDVWGLTEDSQGRIWVQTFSKQLVYIKEDSIHQIKTNQAETLRLNTIHETFGKVWFRGFMNYHEIVNDSLVTHNFIKIDSRPINYDDN